MRTIKFRGKPIKTDRDDLVYGWGCFTDESERYFIVVDPHQFIQVEKIDGFTGLRDKNGKEIYEGDIVKPINGMDGEHGVIDWDKKRARLDINWSYAKNLGGYDYILQVNVGIKTIGNIYENPELLERKP